MTLVSKVAIPMVASILVLHFVTKAANGAELDRERIAELWNFQRTNIVSLTVNCRRTRWRVPDDHRIERSRVRELIKSEGFPTDRAVLSDVLYQLAPDLRDTGEPWAKVRVLFDGDRVREDTFDRKAPLTVVRDRGVTIFARPKQIELSLPGTKRLRLPSLQDFRVVPSDEVIYAADLASENSGDRISVRRRNTHVILDPSNGFVDEIRNGVYGQGVYWETMQAAPTVYADGSILPQWLFKSEYVGERLHSFTLTVMEEAVPNVPISPIEYKVPVKAGEVVVDTRSGQSRVYTASKDYDDVIIVDFDEAKAGPVRKPMTSRKLSNTGWLVGANVGVVLCALALLARKHLKKST